MGDTGFGNEVIPQLGSTPSVSPPADNQIKEGGEVGEI